MKKILSVVLAVLMIALTVPFSFATDGDKLTVNEDGSFRILQLADIQQGTNIIHDRTLSVIKLAIKKYNPNLIVLTGDNIKGETSYAGYESTVKQLVSLFENEDGEKIPFAVTYGNHDYEHNTLNGIHSIELENEIFLKNGAIDYDDKTISDTGTGYIDVYSCDGKTVVQRVILINTGTYNPGRGYAKAGYNQCTQKDRTNAQNEERYNQIVEAVDSWTNDGYPTVVYQYIPLRELYMGDTPETSILVKDSNGMSSPDFVDNGKTYKFSQSTTNPTVSGEWREFSGCSRPDTSEMYKALAKDNVQGIFYGHDHADYIMGETTVTYDGTPYTLTQGYGGGFYVYTGMYEYEDNNPYCSAYYIDKNGNLEKHTGNFYTYTMGEDTDIYSTASQYISDVRLFSGDTVAKAVANAKKAGYTAIEKSINDTGTYADLNSGSGGDRVVVGYKTTNRPDKAITALRLSFQSRKASENDVVTDSFTQTIEGKTVTFEKTWDTTPVDANEGNDKSNGTHGTMFLYQTKDRNAGRPIESLFVSVYEDSTVYFNPDLLPYARATFMDSDETAELNKDGGGDYIYLFSKLSMPVENCKNHADKSGGTVTVQPTCTEKGEKIYICSDCKGLIKTEVLEKADVHVDKNDDGVCDACGEKLATAKPEYCSCNCHKTGFASFVYKIQKFFWKLFGTHKTCKCGAVHY